MSEQEKQADGEQYTSAAEKLQKELETATDRQSDPIIEYLKKRCEEDHGLAEDILQEHKTWGRCYEHITSMAREQAREQLKPENRKGAVMVHVPDDTVFEWAEDYYRMDDKEIVEEEKQRKAEREKAEAEERQKARENEAKEKPAAKSKEVQTEEPKPVVRKKTEKKSKSEEKQTDGQLSLFDFISE